MLEEVIVTAIYTFNPATDEYTFLREFISPTFSACVDLARAIAISGEDLLVECVYFIDRVGDPA